MCDEEYATTYVEPTYGVPRCQFGTDAAALLRAVDELCSVVHAEGMPCSTPLADATLPSALGSLPQYDGRGVLGWMRLMDGSTPDYTLRHVDVWATSCIIPLFSSYILPTEALRHLQPAQRCQTQ